MERDKKGIEYSKDFNAHSNFGANIKMSQSKPSVKSKNPPIEQLKRNSSCPIMGPYSRPNYLERLEKRIFSQNSIDINPCLSKTKQHSPAITM